MIGRFLSDEGCLGGGGEGCFGGGGGDFLLAKALPRVNLGFEGKDLGDSTFLTREAGFFAGVVNFFFGEEAFFRPAAMRREEMTVMRDESCNSIRR